MDRLIDNLYLPIHSISFHHILYYTIMIIYVLSVKLSKRYLAEEQVTYLNQHPKISYEVIIIMLIEGLPSLIYIIFIIIIIIIIIIIFIIVIIPVIIYISITTTTIIMTFIIMNIIFSITTSITIIISVIYT